MWLSKLDHFQQQKLKHIDTIMHNFLSPCLAPLWIQLAISLFHGQFDPPHELKKTTNIDLPSHTPTPPKKKNKKKKKNKRC